MKTKYVVFLLLLVGACGEKSHQAGVNQPTPPVTVTHDGARIEFADDVGAGYFSVIAVQPSRLPIRFSAPGHVVATVVASVESNGQNLVLFDNPELTTTYSALLQHLINIKTNTANVARVKDMADKGAASGRDLIEAETTLANEKAAMLEHEARLKLAGLSPDDVLKAKPHAVWIVCDVPETQVSSWKPGSSCQLQFSVFPQRTVTGRVEDWGDIVDPVTRMVKLRIAVTNPSPLMKAGMFVTATFESEGTTSLVIPREAMITVQGRYYVFVRTTSRTFERREVQPGDQIQDSIIIYDGLRDNETIVRTGTMQLKGLSFGY